jgi:aspartate kinase
MAVIEPVVKSIGARECVSDTKLAKVSVIGAGMQTAPGYAARMFSALYEEGVNIELITTSEIRITCIVDEARAGDAVRALHRAFELEKGV